MVEAFIRLTGETLEQTRRAARLIKESGGRPRHTYPPGVMIASIPFDLIETLIHKREIASIDLKEIAEERIGQSGGDIAFAMAAWNRHLRRRLIRRPRPLLMVRTSARKRKWEAAPEREPSSASSSGDAPTPLTQPHFFTSIRTIELVKRVELGMRILLSSP